MREPDFLYVLRTVLLEEVCVHDDARLAMKSFEFSGLYSRLVYRCSLGPMDGLVVTLLLG